ncbi:MAG: DNA polymerase III subunit delta, partial [Odoribacteraceae bacterium]|nr:DNA polymerase III subunit delta [Odoribacteraceae bacterium]
MKYEEIMAQVKAGNFAPVYFLSGEEPFFIDRIAGEIEARALPEEERVMNQVVLYGNETSMARVVDVARRFPMMAARQVVIVREAQGIADKEYEKLLPYLARVQPTTLLAFLYKGKKPDKRREAFKKLANHPSCVYFDSAKLYDNEVPAWIERYCKERRRPIAPRAARLLADSLGTELSRIANALDKLMLLAPGGEEIKEQMVVEHVGISKEYNAFELVAAISRLDHLKANRVVNYFEANPGGKNSDLPRITAAIFYYFCNLLTYHYLRNSTPNQQEIARALGVPPHTIKDYTDGAARYGAGKCARVIALLREHDVRSKGGAGIAIPPGELLRE